MEPAERGKDLLSKQELCLGNYSNPGAGDGADISLLAAGRGHESVAPALLQEGEGC